MAQPVSHYSSQTMRQAGGLLLQRVLAMLQAVELPALHPFVTEQPAADNVPGDPAPQGAAVGGNEAVGLQKIALHQGCSRSSGRDSRDPFR